MEKMINEVKAISKKNGMDLDRGFDMFRSNCEQGEERYKGSGTYDYSICPSDKEFGLLRKKILQADRKNN